MVQSRKKDRRRKIGESDRVETRLRRARERNADQRNSYWRNPQLEGNDPGSEVMEENHERGKDEHSIVI